MTITVANAINRVAYWAIGNRHMLPADIREAVATLAEAAVKKLMAGPRSDEIALLRGE
ncbi:hypothetical protein [Prescottella equi]|uniref:Uncharacterized protein n=1 Tax=Rhodococcus phage REQ2 TaxID=1109713 RepID=G9FH12_9CAUD|nr:hypothetical protein [Prescottella equi]YP_005087113.1 hypothetical protein RoPhREQ2_gp69 [Rhodococcus phage REQ2]AEV51923.1 hypothetical protein [Rhodococcus phage REQ2]